MISNLFKCLSSAALLLSLQGCDSKDATFVTATHIGIKADTKTEQVQIGYGRTDLFVGPGYPDVGAMPAAIGSIRSNLQVFNPKITQLYATGQAADDVTREFAPTGPLPDMTLQGERRPLVFATNTDIGLKLGFIANVPSSINFGYNREELSFIPFRPHPPGSGESDVYAPVLAAISLNVAAKTGTDSGMLLNQFFATGKAALNLARHQEIRQLFNNDAGAQIDQAALTAAQDARTVDMNKIDSYFGAGNDFAIRCPKLFAAAGFPAGALPPEISCSTTKAQLLKGLSGRPDIAHMLAQKTSV